MTVAGTPVPGAPSFRKGKKAAPGAVTGTGGPFFPKGEEGDTSHRDRDRGPLLSGRERRRHRYRHRGHGPGQACPKRKNPTENYIFLMVFAIFEDQAFPFSLLDGRPHRRS